MAASTQSGRERICPSARRLAVVFHHHHHHRLDRGGDLVLPPAALQPTVVCIQVVEQCPDRTSANMGRTPGRGGHRAWIRKERW
jgi:hypothetical protein